MTAFHDKVLVEEKSCANVEIQFSLHMGALFESEVWLFTTLVLVFGCF